MKGMSTSFGNGLHACCFVYSDGVAVAAVLLLMLLLPRLHR